MIYINQYILMENSSIKLFKTKKFNEIFFKSIMILIKKKL